MTTNGTESLSHLRSHLVDRRIVRQRRRRLQHELASFTSPAERAELAAILARHSPGEAPEIEAALNRPTTWSHTTR